MDADGATAALPSQQRYPEQFSRREEEIDNPKPCYIKMIWFKRGDTKLKRPARPIMRDHTTVSHHRITHHHLRPCPVISHRYLRQQSGPVWDQPANGVQGIVSSDCRKTHIHPLVLWQEAKNDTRRNDTITLRGYRFRLNADGQPS